MTREVSPRVSRHRDEPWDGGGEDVATRGGPAVDPTALARALSEAVEGEVRFDAAARGAYAHDASHYRQPPIGVVVPRHERDVVEAVRVCREHDAPILGRGGGTSLAGQCCNVAVVIDFSKSMHDILEIVPEERVARVQPGCVLDDLRRAAAPHGLTFGPDPATHDHCTLGGMIMNDSCGVHSVLAAQYGPGPRTEHQVVSLRVLTYDGDVLEVRATSEAELDRTVAEGGRRGEILGRLRDLRDRHAEAIRARYPDIPRRVSGYNLPPLLPEHGFDVARALCGTEGTCVVLLEATVRLVWKPRHEVLVVVGYDDVAKAADHVPRALESRPVGLEGIDRGLLRDMRHEHVHADDLKLLPDGEAFLLVELGSDDREEASRSATALQRALASEDSPPRGMKAFDDPAEQARVWEIRESGLGATAWVPGEAPTWPGFEDAAVPPEVLGEYLRDFRALLDRHGRSGDLYGHFGQGCVHTRIDFDLRTRGGVEEYRRFVEDAADLVVRHGGSISGEHGDGQSKAALLGKMYGDALLDAFREFKAVWDPRGRLNPGKLVDPYAPEQNLRLGWGTSPAPRETRFTFRNDLGGFLGAAERCVGVGKCRRAEGGVMCPSYRVTRDEIHSTRGRARLLFEMMRGDVVTGGWRSSAVKEALDLCLSCKGCRRDCPVDVDMATYKAEFLSHHYEGRLRPRHAYAMGLVHEWARLAALAPRLVNAVTHAPGLDRLAKWLAGAAPSREIPRFARRTLRDWFHREHRPRAGDLAGATVAAGADWTQVTSDRRRRVLLWPDTFTNAFSPEIGRAAVEVLERAGMQVVMPEKDLCCGRPLYESGFVDRARRRLREILDELRPEIQAGTPIVGLEPSCVSAFRDEVLGLHPHDIDAHRLARQTYALGEFVEEHHAEFDLPRLGGKALVQAHCHHHSVLDWSAEERLLDRLGLDWSRPESSCCGMAGAFGFQAGETHDVSVALAERALAPAVRGAVRGTRIVADGFSCREQIRQLTGRVPLHLAELLRGGVDGADTSPGDA